VTGDIPQFAGCSCFSRKDSNPLAQQHYNRYESRNTFWVVLSYFALVIIIHSQPTSLTSNTNTLETTDSGSLHVVFTIMKLRRRHVDGIFLVVNVTVILCTILSEFPVYPGPDTEEEQSTEDAVEQSQFSKEPTTASSWESLSYSSSPFPSWNHTQIERNRVGKGCTTSTSCSSWLIITLTVSSAIAIAIGWLLQDWIACSKLILVWNRISRYRENAFGDADHVYSSRGTSHSTCPEERLRRIRYSLPIQRLGDLDTKTRATTACPICFAEFRHCGRHEFIAVCREGCKHVFHRTCLYEWMLRSDNCPCCRKTLINAPPHRSSVLADFSTFLGYYPPS
jgi:hypothetical protein